MPAALQRPKQPQSSNDDWHTRDRAAEISQFSTRFIDLQIRAGKLKAVKVGKRSVRIADSALRSWMESHSAIGSADRPELPQRTQSQGVEHSDQKSELDPSEPNDPAIEALNQADPPSQSARYREMVAAAKSQV